ncbi:DOPA 4,5-dioxygenase family protein [Nisaea nitritireducens]|uniref:DOPA 4,5-dioxygenase family protein n=1 Tax=Nisaea nitritireducens TaxID=568392 RepID=UPI0018689422|nr:DOPA 4,5-dioxygenase family protein [Nisaea nitritireducens]
MTKDTSEILGYHAHVYFDAGSAEAARALREVIERQFDIEMGRFHEKPVGPHPRWSYQVAFKPEQFGDIIPWLALNRGDLTVFVHAETGNELADHTQHVIWLGPSDDLKVSMFEK